MQDPWQAAMCEGDFARAWTISDRHLEQRLANGASQADLPRHLQSVWDGRSLAGKHVLVRCYHGLGDTVQFVRFARPLRAIAREVSVWCQPQLMRLISTAEGVDRVLPLHDGAPEICCDGEIEIMELAHALRIRSCDLPGPVPYLRPAPLKPRSALTNEQLNVGLVWQAGDWDQRRSLELSMFAPLFRLQGLRFHSLQRGPARAQLERSGIADLSTDDVDVLAATLHGLDLLISVDTFVAHLAGALGVPTWLLLHSDCDWRWMRRGERSMWYPSMRCFRQQDVGDWNLVLNRVVSELSHLRTDCFKAQQPAETILRNGSIF